MPKIMQRFMHDLELLTDALERADTPFPIRVHRINVYAPKKENDILNKYKITEPNLLIAASPQNGVRVIFRYKNEKSVNPYNNSQVFRSAESLARQAIWEAGFYSDWKEIKDGILEPGKFRGEETLVKSILDISVPSQTNKTIYFVRGHGEASLADTDPRAETLYCED